MELELKHLAPYLPYGLNIYNFDNGFMFTQQMVANISKSELGNIVNIESIDGEKYKPILRPLSDLLKEIKEGFIVMDYLSWGDISDYNVIIKNDVLLNNISFLDYQVLIEHHFDVYGLIDAGLAIDKNTISD